MARWETPRAFAAVMALALVGCDSDGNSCNAAGGQCVLGSAICNLRGSQDCANGGPISPGGFFCCLSNAQNCGQPDATTYVYPTGVEGGVSCQGPPEPPGFTPGGDDDASYPAGCIAKLPVCNNGQPIECLCRPGASPAWECGY
jgi:hypothetical protein